MLKRAHIQRYKSLTDVRVELTDLSVLIGPNAVGKSNFLDALQLLSRIATTKNLEAAFEPPYRGTALQSCTFGPGGIRDVLAKRRASFSIEVDIALSQSVLDRVNQRILDLSSASSSSQRKSPSIALVRERNLRYRIEVQVLTESGFLQVIDEYLAPIHPDGRVKANRSPFLEKVHGRLTLRMERQAHPRYFEPNQNYALLSETLDPTRYPHIVAAREELSQWLFFYFEPRERMRAAAPLKATRHVGQMGEDLAAFLNTIRAESKLQYKSIENALRLFLGRSSRVEVRPNDVGQVELYLIENDREIPAALLSEGTLRLLGLLALSGATPRPSLICFEEPENGLHPRRIELIAEVLKRLAIKDQTSVIVTTHSPILPKFVGETSLFKVYRVKEQTQIKPLGKPGPLLADGAVSDALSEQPDVYARLMRGDFDGP